MVLEAMETNGETNKAGGNKDKLQGITLEARFLECSACFEPLRPFTFQCSSGHVVCSDCYYDTGLDKCHLQPLRRHGAPCLCHQDSLLLRQEWVPEDVHFAKKTREKQCPHGPCFCPDLGCGFTGPAEALADHLAGEHYWPSTPFKYYEQFAIRAEPGPHVLRSQDDRRVFLVNMSAAGPVGHAISIICVQPGAGQTKHSCSVVLSCFTGHHQIATLDHFMGSSLSDGLPKDFCVMPKASDGAAGAVLRTTIHPSVEHVSDNEPEMTRATTRTTAATMRNNLFIRNNKYVVLWKQSTWLNKQSG